MKKTLKIVIAIAATILISGCSVTQPYSTLATTYQYDKDSNKAEIKVDQDSNLLGDTLSGGTVRTNYKYSFGVSAKKTIDQGFKYFTIIEPKELAKQFEDRGVTNVQEAYDACDEGEGSFFAGYNVKYPFNSGRGKGYNCDDATNSISMTTLLTQETHKIVKYVIVMHNEPRANSAATFNAQEVLDSKLLEGLNKDYFLSGTR